MYLHTRLLLGIAAVTLAALLLSVLVPLGSVRPDVDRETEATLQLTTLLVSVEDRVRSAPDAAAALAAAAAAVRQSQPLRHVRITLQDAVGRPVAATALDADQGGWLAAELADGSGRAQLSYPLNWSGGSLGSLARQRQPALRGERDRGARGVGSAAAGAGHPRHGRRGVLHGPPRPAARGADPVGAVTAAGRRPRDAAAAFSGQGSR